jgi:hypothetical protein
MTRLGGIQNKTGCPIRAGKGSLVARRAPTLVSVTAWAGQVRQLDEISHGPKRHFRLPPGRWLLAAVTAGIVAAAAALVASGVVGHRGASPRRTGAPGTFLLGCDSADWNQLNPDWRSSSLRVGPLWFVDSSQSGYVRSGGSPGTAAPSPGAAAPSPGARSALAGDGGPSTDAVMLLEVAAGSTVVMKAASGTRSYFRFLSGFGPGTAYPLPPGDTGFTFVACPRQHAGPNGRVTDFMLGFSIGTGRTAPVEIWTSASSRPAWVTFAAPAGALSAAGPLPASGALPGDGALPPGGVLPMAGASVPSRGPVVVVRSPSQGACSVRIRRP